jgi:hypothetical protein
MKRIMAPRPLPKPTPIIAPVTGDGRVWPVVLLLLGTALATLLVIFGQRVLRSAERWWWLRHVRRNSRQRGFAVLPSGKPMTAPKLR